MVADGAEFMTVADAARFLKVSRVTIHRWLKQGHLRAYHVGPRTVRIRRQDLQRAIVPTHALESVVDLEARPIATSLAAVPPLTAEEIRRARKTMVEANRLGEEILARRNGQPLDESWPIIREAREARSAELA